MRDPHVQMEDASMNSPTPLTPNTPSLENGVDEPTSEIAWDTMRHLYKFRHQGSQGATGLVELGDGRKMVYKISTLVNFGIEHEYRVMQGLNELATYCPSFPRVYAIQPMKLHPNYGGARQNNPFETHPSPIVLPVLFMEYIEGPVLFDFIQTLDVPNIQEVIVSIVQRILLAIVIAQRAKGFVHYDLYANNIILRPTNPHDVHAYLLDANNVFMIPTYGFVPVLIDFGFSTSSDVFGHPVQLSMEFETYGLIAPYFDPLEDAKRFLVSFSEYIRSNCLDHEFAKTFRYFVIHAFRSLRLQWTKGYDAMYTQLDLNQTITSALTFLDDISTLWKGHSHYLIGTIQALNVLPLRPQCMFDPDTFREAMRICFTEFTTIEATLPKKRHSIYSLYVFRTLIETVQPCLDDYRNESTRSNVVRYIQCVLYDTIASIAQFPRLQDVNWDRLLCSLCVIQESLAAVYSTHFEAFVREKQAMYQQLPFPNTESILAAFSMAFPLQTHATEDTNLVVYNVIEHETNEYELTSEEWNTITNRDALLQGMQMWQTL